MLVADGGGGGTDWSSLTVEQMQTMIQSPDVAAQNDMTATWAKTSELLTSHVAQMMNYRQGLAQAWPPEKSAASANYLARIDEMIDSLNRTQQAALDNYDALAQATSAIVSAQTKMNTIYQQHQSNQQLLTTFNATLAAKSGTTPPVSAGEQDSLKQQAVAVMSGISTDLALAQLKLVDPPIYDPPAYVNDKDNSGGTDSSSNGSAPTVPPIVVTPVATPASKTPSNGTPSTPFPTSTGGTPTTPVIGSTPTTVSIPTPTGSQPGLVLGSTGPLPTTSTTPITGGTTPLTTGPGGFSSTPFVPTSGIPTSTTGQFGRTSSFSGESTIRSGALSEGLPRGVSGVIGEPAGGVGGTGSARAGLRRVNPVGGVIGEEGIGGRASGARGMVGSEGTIGGGRGGRGLSSGERSVGGRGALGESGTYGSSGGRRGGRRDDSESQQWDPDNPWATDEGVDPVVLPSNEQRIDPGPAIGLR